MPLSLPAQAPDFVFNRVQARKAFAGPDFTDIAGDSLDRICGLKITDSPYIFPHALCGYRLNNGSVCLWNETLPSERGPNEIIAQHFTDADHIIGAVTALKDTVDLLR